MTLSDFWRDIYLPHLKQTGKPSSIQTVSQRWRLYVEPVLGDRELESIKLQDVQLLLFRLTLGRHTISAVKALIQTLFRHALQNDLYHSPNPSKDASLPKRPRPAEMPWYSLAEVTGIIDHAPNRLKPLLTTAAFTGLRHGELRGLQWEDYDGQEIKVRRNVYRNITDETKSSESDNAVPIIRTVRVQLDPLRQASGIIFVSRSGRPLRLDTIGRFMASRLKGTKFTWKGWHAFRRGLASNLHQLGIDDKTIQRILRHRNVATTQQMYIKTTPESARLALDKLGSLVEGV